MRQSERLLARALSAGRVTPPLSPRRKRQPGDKGEGSVEHPLSVARHEAAWSEPRVEPLKHPHNSGDRSHPPADYCRSPHGGIVLVCRDHGAGQDEQRSPGVQRADDER